MPPIPPTLRFAHSVVPVRFDFVNRILGYKKGETITAKAVFDTNQVKRNIKKLLTGGSPHYKSLLQLYREQIQDEFNSGHFITASGAKEQWKEASPFWLKKMKVQGGSTLKRRGKLLNAYLGKGAGAIQEKVPREEAKGTFTISFGVNGNLMPHAAYFRGRDPNRKRDNRIRATPESKAAIMKKYKVYISPERRWFVVTTRPHGFMNKKLEAAMLNSAKLWFRENIGLENR